MDSTLSVKQRILSVFVIFYVFCMFMMAWPWPASEATKEKVLGPAIGALDFVGVWHRLRLFAPTPPLAHGNVEFQVTYDDGTTENWKPAREQFAPGEKPDSYQRYYYYYVLWGWERKMDGIWPALAAYIARQCQSSTRHPVWVVFVENYAWIPPIGQALPEPDHHTVLMNYHVPTGKVTIGDGQVAVW
ncbi:hypothetical protein ABS71_04510 [bacterium SCN 62-11]|nr:hypothetical protein [Candidatus Eremiobacteraeota bacterium]ODT75350.1 MAG: hypothetical protein ABS71_04510 [bacterium SCN 62-11]